MAFTAYTDKDQEQEKLRGVIPQHYLAYRIFIVLRWAALAFVIFSVIFFGGQFIDNPLFSMISQSRYYRMGILVLLGCAAACLVFCGLIWLIWLRKPPFDDWVFEIAEKKLGTEVIYYNSRCLYIQYDRASAKEVDKKEFVTEMSDKSIHYSYFLVKTFIDEGVIQVECTRRQPIPERASFSADDDLYWNIIPIGLTVNQVTQGISPIGWYLNDQNKNDLMVETVPSTSILIAGGTGSGKSVLEQSIVGHVSRYPDNFQLVGVDCKRVEFNLLRGVKGVKGVALDVKSAADTVAAFQQIMMARFKFMEDMKVNNVYKIKDAQVDYYEVFGRSYQFDEIFELKVDITEQSAGRDYDKLMRQYPDGRQPKILTIEDIYKGIKKGEWQNPQLPEVKGYNSYVTVDDFKITKNTYKPKALIFLADELNELMNSDDYKSVDIVKQSLGSIARLGRAAGVHLALACQRASGGTISADLKNNIQQSILLGGFDSGASTLMFEKDISNLAKPEIKGRAFMQSGNVIVEVQTYYTQPENDWVFDETQKETYLNPEYEKQKKKRKEVMDQTGFVDQHPITEKFDPTEDDDDVSEDDFEDDDWHEDDFEEAPFTFKAGGKEIPVKPSLEKKPDKPEDSSHSRRPLSRESRDSFNQLVSNRRSTTDAETDVPSLENAISSMPAISEPIDSESSITPDMTPDTTPVSTEENTPQDTPQQMYRRVDADQPVRRIKFKINS